MDPHISKDFPGRIDGKWTCCAGGPKQCVPVFSHVIIRPKWREAPSRIPEEDIP